ncbi:hypothetical protein [Nevskia ramosa]|uniref:hypothetical protein n=1 Tax=Nevskia ramosa TaxID=64002 RepID=UPI003D124902
MQVKKFDQREAALNKEREARFVTERDQQAGPFCEAKCAKEAPEAKSAAPQRQFEVNDKEST